MSSTTEKTELCNRLAKVLNEIIDHTKRECKNELLKGLEQAIKQIQEKGQKEDILKIFDETKE